MAMISIKELLLLLLIRYAASMYVQQCKGYDGRCSNGDTEQSCSDLNIDACYWDDLDYSCDCVGNDGRCHQGASKAECEYAIDNGAKCTLQACSGSARTSTPTTASPSTLLMASTSTTRSPSTTTPSVLATSILMAGTSTTPFASTTSTIPTITASCAQNAAGGGNHTVILKEDGSVHAAGRNHKGQLGDGSYLDRHSFVQVVSSGGSAIAAGSCHTLFLKNDGSLHATGRNKHGELGDGSSIDKLSFVQVSRGGSAIAAGAAHSMLLKNDGSVHAAGMNEFGQLGDGSSSDKHSFVAVVSQSSIAIAAGGYHSVLLKSDGSVHVAGMNHKGQLGDGSYLDKQSFVLVLTSGASAITAGRYHTVLLKNDGSVHTAGRNDKGQLGDGSSTNRCSFVQVILSGSSAIEAGKFHTVILKNDGSVHTVGGNTFGQLGDGTTTHKLSFVQVVASGGRAIAAALYYTLILRTDGSACTVGANGFGQLGDGTIQNKLSFVQVVPKGVGVQCNLSKAITSTQSSRSPTTTTTTTSAQTSTQTTSSAQVIKALRGTLTLQVSNATKFVQEPQVIQVLEIAIAAMLEINRSWVQNVTVNVASDVGRRLEDEDLTMAISKDVQIEFDIIVPEDGSDPYVVAAVIYERFEAASIAKATDAIQSVINSGILSQDYDVQIQYKQVAMVVPSTPPQEEPIENGNDAELVAIILILGSSVIGLVVVACIWKFRRQLAKWSGQSIHRNSLLSLDNAFLEAAGPMGAMPTGELLSPPAVILEKHHSEMLRFLSAMICDTEDDEVDVFISYALAHRLDDAEGSGPGMYYVAALLRALYLQGVNCLTPVPGVLDRHEFLLMIRTHRIPRRKVMLIVETPDLFQCLHALEEICAAEYNSFDMYRVRFDGLEGIKGERCLAEWKSIDATHGRSLSSRYFELPGYPEFPDNILQNGDSLRELALQWRLKCDVARSGVLDTATIGKDDNEALLKFVAGGKDHTLSANWDRLPSNIQQPISREDTVDDSQAKLLSSTSSLDSDAAQSEATRSTHIAVRSGKTATRRAENIAVRKGLQRTQTQQSRSLAGRLRSGTSSQDLGAPRQGKKKPDTMRSPNQEISLSPLNDYTGIGSASTEISTYTGAKSFSTSLSKKARQSTRGGSDNRKKIQGMSPPHRKPRQGQSPTKLHKDGSKESKGTM